MILRLEFDELPGADVSKQVLLYSVTSYTALHSDTACRLQSTHIKGECGKDRICFWYVDDGILEEMYFGVEKSINHLRSFPGVKQIQILQELHNWNPWKDWTGWCQMNADLYNTHLGRILLPYV
jgi:hypothetical protein